MGSGEVIDLLSSEDELIPKSCVVPKGQTVSRAAGAGDFRFIEDDSDDTIREDNEWATAPAKRRKLNSPALEAALPVLMGSGERRHEYTSAKVIVNNAVKEDDVWANYDDADPIAFTSSATYSKTVSNPKGKPIGFNPIESDESNSSLPDDILDAMPRFKNLANLSERSTALLASLAKLAPRTKPGKRSGNLTKKNERTLSQDAVRHASASETDDMVVEKGTAPKPKKSKPTDDERRAREVEKEKAKEAKARERDMNKEQKAREKEEERARKRLQKYEKANEKRIAMEIAEVNKSKLDKKDSTPEMIVDLPASIDGSSVETQAREFLKNLGVDVTLYQSPVPHVVKWRRKMKAKWNPELDYWEPLDRMVIEDEKHVMCLMPAKQFASLAMAGSEDEDVETHVSKIKSVHPGCLPIYLIEGLQALVRKNKTAENRAYQAKVLGQDQANGVNPVQPSKRRSIPELLDEDLIEDALLRLQVANGCLVHHTNTALESAEWIANSTQHISTIPYRYVTPFYPKLSPR